MNITKSRLNSTMDNYLSFTHDKTNIVTAIVHLFLVLYAGVIAQSLPLNIIKFLNHPYVRVILFCMILFISAYEPVTAIIASVCVVVTIQVFNKYKFTEQLVSLAANGKNENCSCFCSDDELNDVLEKHLQKKNHEINENIKKHVSFDDNPEHKLINEYTGPSAFNSDKNNEFMNYEQNSNVENVTVENATVETNVVQENPTQSIDFLEHLKTPNSPTDIVGFSNDVDGTYASL